MQLKSFQIILILLVICTSIFRPSAVMAEVESKAGSPIMYDFLWLLISSAGLYYSFRIVRAFWRGKLALPWSLITAAFAVFAITSMVSLGVRAQLFEFDLSHHSSLQLLGLLIFLVAGYFYKRLTLGGK
ncbi:MAG: hypothetical protein GF315_11370 [candidate division Zixibacteria bacterium]|nr:hypothetical protein [candidate division Zixibacteria bacterium]